MCLCCMCMFYHLNSTALSRWKETRTAESVSFGPVKLRHVLSAAWRICAFSQRQRSAGVLLSLAPSRRVCAPTARRDWWIINKHGAMALAAPRFWRYRPTVVMPAESTGSPGGGQGMSDSGVGGDWAESHASFHRGSTFSPIDIEERGVTS